MAAFVERMLGASRLSTTTFEEVEHDEQATWKALGVVALASAASSIGLAVCPPIVGKSASGRSSSMIRRTKAGVIGSIIGWYVWAFLTYVIGTRLLPEPGTRATHGELLRTLGFASAPGILAILGVVAPLRPIVFPAVAVWMLAAGVIAVRQALDYTSTWRAIGVVVIGWIAQWVIRVVLYALLGDPEGAI